MKRVLIIVASIILLIILINAVANRATCYWYGYQTERETQYGPLVGCMVKVRDHWVPRNELRTQP